VPSFIARALILFETYRGPLQAQKLEKSLGRIGLTVSHKVNYRLFYFISKRCFGKLMRSCVTAGISNYLYNKFFFWKRAATCEPKLDIVSSFWYHLNNSDLVEKVIFFLLEKSQIQQILSSGINDIISATTQNIIWTHCTLPLIEYSDVI